MTTLTHTTQQPRRDQLFGQRRDDPYLANAKLHEPASCPDCGIVYRKGRWQTGTAGADDMSVRCPACARIHDRMPAGLLTLSGDFFDQHHEEIMRLVHNRETQERNERPLERIMEIEVDERGTTISYTGIHLTRSTGEALRNAYQGELELAHNDRDAPIRVSWHRA